MAIAFLNISKKNKDSILKNIDRENYLGLGFPDCERIDLYTFAAALGYKRGLATEMNGAKESLVREEVVLRNNIRHAYSAMYFADHQKNIQDEIETITDTSMVFPLIDGYANNGFSILNDYMSQYDSRTLALKLIADMDTMYEQYKHDFA